MRKVSVLAALLVLFTVFELGFCSEVGIVITEGVGGTHNCQGFHNSDEIESLARFAVEEHNRLENGLLEFARVLKVQEQIVAGKLYHLTLEAADAGKKKIYEAKIWVKPWMDFKQLQEFKHASNVSPFSVSDLGIMQDGLLEQEIPTHDPEVQSAASHAVADIQMRSNSLLPYELLEILHAKAEIIEDFVKYNLLLKLKRGMKEEMFKVNVHKTSAGNYLLKLMELYNP